MATVWNISDGIEYPHLSDVERLPEFGYNKITEPSPKWIWRLGNNLNHLLYPYLPHEWQPIPQITVQKRRPPLIVFEPLETDFTTNGIRILSPITATYTIEENQAGEIYVEHPLDADGDWRSIIRGYIIYAPVERRGQSFQQPFRIYKVMKKRSSDGKALICAYARHVFYDLNYCMLKDVRPENLNGNDALDWIFDRVMVVTQDSRPQDRFNYYSNIEETATSYFEWKSITAALIGDDNSFVNRWGGKLYVDRYYFSICEPMEFSKSLETGFQLDYQTDMLEIEESIDDSAVCTALYAEDNNGDTASASVPLSVSGMPFHKILHANFSYDIEGEETADRFSTDFAEYFDKMQALDVSYTCRIANMHDNPVYADFINLQTYEVGDTGVIRDVDLDISTVQKIVKKTVDLLTGEVKEIGLGSVKQSLARKKPFGSVVSLTKSAEQKRQDAMQEQMDDLASRALIPHSVIATSGKAVQTASKKYIQYR